MNNYYYFVFNKPSKIVSTLKSIKGYSTIHNYVSTLKYHSLKLVGRLDYHTRGAMLLTSNGLLSYRLTHPSLKVLKKYIVKTKGIPSEQSIKFINAQITGLLTIKQIGITKQKNSWFKVVLCSGENKQIVNLFWDLGVPVLKIIRTAFAGIDVANIHVGNIRKLTNKEILTLCKHIIK